MPPIQNSNIVSYAPEAVYPARSVSPRASRKVANYEPGYWRFTLVFPELKTDNQAQSIYDWLQAGNPFDLDLHNLRLPTVSAAVRATSQTLTDGTLELGLDPTDLEVGMYAVYDGRLVKVLDLTDSAARVIHRPDVLPSMGSLTPATVVRVFMDETSSPSLRGYERSGGMTIQVRTEP